MPEIEIRPAIPVDIPLLVEIEHDYTSEYVWQMDINQTEEGQIWINFREARLPRSVKVDYPRPKTTLLDDWTNRSGVLVATMGQTIVGYMCLMLGIAPATTWMTDLVILRRLRRQGIGSALVLAAQEWARQHDTFRLVMEMQSKNRPAIGLAQKMGFEFCGYNDRYYLNHDIAIFFARTVR